MVTCVPNEIAADIRVFRNDQQGNYDALRFQSTGGSGQAQMKD
jgi:hypothetical protein